MDRIRARVRVPGRAAPDRVRAWAFAPGGGPCARPPGPRGGPPASGRRRHGRALRRTAGPGRGPGSAGDWMPPGAAGQRRERDGLEAGGGVPEIHHQGQDVQTSTRATRQDHATRGRPPGDAGNLAQATGQTGPDRARTSPARARRRRVARALYPAAAPDGGQGGGQAGPGPGPEPGQRPDHGMPRTAVSFATEGGRRHRGQGPARLGQSRITNITSTRPTRRKSSRISRLRQWGVGSSLHNRGRERVLGAGQARPDLPGGGWSAGSGSTLVPRGVWPARWAGPGRGTRGGLGDWLAGGPEKACGRASQTPSPPPPPSPSL